MSKVCKTGALVLTLFAVDIAWGDPEQPSVPTGINPITQSVEKPDVGWSADWVLDHLVGGSMLVGMVLALLFLWQRRKISEKQKPAGSAAPSVNPPRIVLTEAHTSPDVGHPVIVSFTLTNIGGSRATVVWSAFGIAFDHVDAVKRQVCRGDSLLAGIAHDSAISPSAAIEAGGILQGDYGAPDVRWTFVPRFTTDSLGRSVIATTAGDFAWFFFGAVSYIDARKTVRSMAFYRILAHPSYRFVAFGDPQLEYTVEGG